MSSLLSDFPPCGSIVADGPFTSGGLPAPRGGRPMPAVAANPLERLAQLLVANDRLMDELASSRRRVAEARAYQDEPGSNARFGALYLDRCRTKHSGILAQLRANRIEALAILGRGGSAL